MEPEQRRELGLHCDAADLPPLAVKVEVDPPDQSRASHNPSHGQRSVAWASG